MGRRVPAFVFTAALTGLAAAAQGTAAHAPDGGTREQIQSVIIAALPNAPFSATVATEWTHILPDGSKSTVYNHRMVTRDSAGRVFQERRFFAPKGNVETTPVSMLQYDDPTRHERLLCRPAAKVCEIYKMFVPGVEALPAAGPLPNGNGTLTREDLGHQSIDNLDAVGTREITTFNAGVFGNEKPQPVVKEFWYAPRLSVNLVTKRFDPRVSSAQNISLESIDLAEPDPKLFEPPSGYRMLLME